MQKKELNECCVGEGKIQCQMKRLRGSQNNAEMKKTRAVKRGFGCGTAIVSTDGCVSCTTFNILAPIYKRLDKEDPSLRESQCRAYWLSRNQRIIDRLLVERSSIICLQEVWLGNDELVEMYENTLRDAGYTSLKLARTNNRGDGLLTAIRRDCFRIINSKELLFNDFGDRVAQLLHVESVFPFLQKNSCSINQQILIVNTHLLFPHDYTLCIARLHQVYKILQYVESYEKEHKLDRMPIILCGDWNGSKRGRVYKFLRSQGFVSSYDVAHHYSDGDADAHKWVSHRNHRGNICGVDFIWLLNPNMHRKPLRTSWIEAVFGMIKHLLIRRAALTEDNSFAFFKGNSPGDYITFASFSQALSQLGLSGHQHGLSSEQIEDLWIGADIDPNRVLDYREFQQRIWNPTSDKPDQESSNFGTGPENPAIGFNVKGATLFPPEVEKGMWPENYTLSDHAHLTVVFSPIKIPRLQSPS
ncbi:hypothetical protein KSP40_PGU005114 [Platanthera guangdongensis]|uniref:Endonuclease/exonuclease/phosphatase domain-containing protein n=1 Tax=Platanthera guangdongensis TaxID=2320717 RepID=A0ABR2MH80_9ASPA